jgi:poly-gamma-glutamate capsule biosynthesis protein CapA/YwtB (metallophosphatase superfamily)
MGRWAAAALALVVAAAVAVALALDGDDGAPSPPATTAQAPRSERPEKPARARPARKPVRFTVSVSGDLLMHSPLLARALANGRGREYDFAPFFGAIDRYVGAADLALCHLETPLGPGPPQTYPIFNTPTGLAASIRRSGWDACSTASNHSLDQGLEGIRATAAALDMRDIAHTGSFASERASRRPTILRVRGVRIGYLSYTDATNGIPAPTAWAVNEYAAAEPAAGAAAILADARRARRAGAEAVIVNVHWGVEYASAPSASQRDVAERLTRSGLVTAVVGQGPHVVQPISRLNDRFVVFSEGNLVSNQGPGSGLPAPTQDGLIALLRFEAGERRVRVKEVDYVPIWVRPGDYAVLEATPKADPAHAAALRESRARTIAVVGSSDRIAPVGGP